jgi:hypothetical protein
VGWTAYDTVGWTGGGTEGWTEHDTVGWTGGGTEGWTEHHTVGWTGRGTEGGPGVRGQRGGRADWSYANPPNAPPLITRNFSASLTVDFNADRSYASNAATPGRVLPSSHSRKAPPAVLT